MPAFQFEDINIKYICSRKPLDTNITIVENYKEIIDDPNIDAICLSVPPYESFEILNYAILNNKHIFCEKPIAIDLETAHKINPNNIHAINFEICESHIVKQLKDLLANEEVINFNLTWNTKNNNKHHSWKHNVNLGGGVLNNFGSHILNFIEWIFNDKFNSIKGCLYPSLEYNTLVNINIENNKYSGKISLFSDSQTNKFEFIVNCKNKVYKLINNTNNLQNFTILSNDNVISSNNANDLIDGRIHLTSLIARKFINRH